MILNEYNSVTPMIHKLWKLIEYKFDSVVFIVDQ